MSDFDPIAPFYDVEHQGLTSDTTMYTRMATRGQGDVLVMGCGTGRVVEAVRMPGRRVVGVDVSRSMLDLARSKLGLAPDVELVQADVRDLRLDRAFSLVIIPLDTFSLLENQPDQLAVLSACQKHLALHGRLIIDVTNPYRLPGPEQDGLRRLRFEAVEGERKLAAWDSTTVNVAEQLITLRIEYLERTDGHESRKTDVSVLVRWAYRFEIEALLRFSGLEPLEVWGGYEGEPYSDDSDRLIVTAGFDRNV